MPPKVTKRWVPANTPGGASASRVPGGGGGGVDPAADRLSALPDALLHHIMSFMKAWDVVRTCVLSRRWRDLWASAPCVDIRVGRYSEPPDDFVKFVYRLLLARDILAPVDTLRLRSPGQRDVGFDAEDAKMWIHCAIKRKARVIQLNGHINLFADLDSIDFVSRHLKVLKLSCADVFDKFVRELSSRCPSLEELELKDCLVEARKIRSVSLKSLTMVKCAFIKNFSIDAPNLVSVRCIAPERWVPLFENFESLVTGSVMLDDSLLNADFDKYHEEDEFAQTSDEDDEFAQTSDDDDDNNSTHAQRTVKLVPASDDSDEFMSDDIKDNYDYGSDINSDCDTYEYSEIANSYEDRQFGNCDDGCDRSKGGKYHGCNAKYVINDYKDLGGLNILHSLSNARSLDLLGHSGERSPNLEKLFLQLQMNFDIQKALRRGIKLNGGSFACKHLRMVKIRCIKDDPRVHMLAQLFRSNGVPLENIYVRRSGSFSSS